MKLSILLTAGLCAVSGTAEAKNEHKPCERPENCIEKCANGTFHSFTEKGVEKFRCNGTHADYRWAAMVCQQTLGASDVLTRTNCPVIDGMFCDEFAVGQPLKCVADPAEMDVFDVLCSDGRGRWYAKITDPDILFKCPHEQ